MLDPYIQIYGPRLYGLCLHLCGAVPEAEDLYQETWLAALRHLGRYDENQPFEPWLTKICVNTYRNFRRSAARRPQLQAYATEEEQAAALEALPAAEETDYSALHAAISRLPEKLRLTVLLFYFRDMELSGTAKALGVPVGTVKSRLSRARNLLKEALLHEDDLPF